MAKTMEILKAIVVFLVLVPLIKAVSVEEEMAQLKHEMSQLKTLMRTKVDITDYQTLMRTKVDITDYQVRLNDTEELEARVTVLEEAVEDLETSVVELTDETDDIESTNLLQDERLNALDEEVSDNINDIEDLVDLTSTMQDSVSELDLRVTTLEINADGPWESCESSPCDNNATCIDVNVDTFICSCPRGYFGITCAESYEDSIFFARLTLDVTGIVNPLLFADDMINPGGHYNSTTGKYTVPYDGIYQFSVTLQNNDYMMLEMYIDNSQTNAHNDMYVTSTTYYRSTTVLHELTAGQTVHVATGHSSGGAVGSTSYLESYFSGRLISA